MERGSTGRAAGERRVRLASQAAAVHARLVPHLQRNLNRAPSARYELAVDELVIGPDPAVLVGDEDFEARLPPEVVEMARRTAVFDRLRSDPGLWHFALHGARDVAELLVAGHERQYLQAFLTRVSSARSAELDSRSIRGSSSGLCDAAVPRRARLDFSSAPLEGRARVMGRACSLDLETREPLEPARQIPVPIAEELHRAREED
jgi:hypothetical protein